jgi:Pentapeptide repeats (8 copies)
VSRRKVRAVWTCSLNVLHVLTRWAAWPWWVRWLAYGIAAVALAAIVWALFVPLADWLAHHDVGSATGVLHETALDNARGRLLTLGAGLVALVAVVFTARTFHLSREGQVTDRYAKAVEQLGSDKLDVRIGGIYALERIARDSARDHPVVMEVLTAFIREHSHEPWPPPRAPGTTRITRQARFRADGRLRPIRADIQAAVSVVGRRDTERDVRPVNLHGANLAGATILSPDFLAADLAGADLRSARLTWAILIGADLRDADLRDADLREADLGGARLDGAGLAGADLADADLGAARWPTGAPVPPGWKLDAHGRLVPAGAGSGPAEAD